MTECGVVLPVVMGAFVGLIVCLILEEVRR